MEDQEQKRLIDAEQEISELDALLSSVKAQLTSGQTAQGKELTPTNSTDLMKLWFRTVEARAKLRGVWPAGLEGESHE